MTENQIRSYGTYHVVREDDGVLEFSALGPVEHDSDTGFSHHGVIGAGLGLDEGCAAAQHCARALISAAEEHLGDLDHIRSVRRLRVFVATAAGFEDHAVVANAASEVLIDRLGSRGEHARTVVGVASLPFGLPVVVEMTATTDRQSKDD